MPEYSKTFLTRRVPSKVFGGDPPVDWLGDPPEYDPAQIAESYEADVVVIGSGHAGLNAAWKAARGGKSVLVVEEQRADQFYWWGEQIGHFNSHYLFEHGFAPTDPDEVLAEFQKQSGWRINSALVSQFIRESGRAFDDLISLIPEGSSILDHATIQITHGHEGNRGGPSELGGLKTWGGTVCFRKAIYDQPVPGVGAGSTLNDLNRLVQADAERCGARWFYGHSAQVLTQSPDGAVTSCIAEDRSTGRLVRFSGRAVVLAAGDFGGNHEMFLALLDEFAEAAERRGIPRERVHSVFGRSGMGHKLGLWAGGRIESAPRAAIASPKCGGPFGCVPFVWLNANGERFCNESAPVGALPMVLRQPIGSIAAVFDATWLTQIESLSMAFHGNPDFGVPEYIEQAREDMAHVLDAGKEGYPVRHLAITERRGATVYGAASLDELADILGYSDEAKDRFLASISHYNDACRAGSDLDFGRDPRALWPVAEPPYYAVLTDNRKVDFGLCTLAGLVTDDKMNVLRDDDRPIPGLYAVGNCLGGRYALLYPTPIAGNSIGMAVTHGQLLGEQLAATL